MDTEIQKNTEFPKNTGNQINTGNPVESSETTIGQAGSQTGQTGQAGQTGSQAGGAVSDERRLQAEKAGQLAGQNMQKKIGCCAAVVAAVEDALPVVGRCDPVFCASSLLDGTSTPSGQQTCGAFAGAAIVIGQKFGRQRVEDGFSDAPTLGRQILRKVYNKYAERYGSVICQQVRTVNEGKCALTVALAAEWTAEAILAVTDTVADTVTDAVAGNVTGKQE